MTIEEFKFLGHTFEYHKFLFMAHHAYIYRYARPIYKAYTDFTAKNDLYIRSRFSLSSFPLSSLVELSQSDAVNIGLTDAVLVRIK